MVDAFASFWARLHVPVDCTTELNHHGQQFLQKLFEKYDEVRLWISVSAKSNLYKVGLQVTQLMLVIVFCFD